jgi:hypothetical protein
MEDTNLSWRKSSYSGNGGATCVEVGNADRVLVRDTQDRTGPVLRLSPAAWRRFAEQVKRSLVLGCRRRRPQPVTFRSCWGLRFTLGRIARARIKTRGYARPERLFLTEVLRDGTTTPVDRTVVAW